MHSCNVQAAVIESKLASFPGRLGPGNKAKSKHTKSNQQRIQQFFMHIHPWGQENIFAPLESLPPNSAISILLVQKDVAESIKPIALVPGHVVASKSA